MYIYIHIHQYLYVPSLSLRWTGNEAHVYPCSLGLGVLDRMMSSPPSAELEMAPCQPPVLYKNQCVAKRYLLLRKERRLTCFLIVFLKLVHHLPALWNLTKPSSFPHFRWAKDAIIWRRNSLKNDQDASQFVLRGNKEVSIFRYI